MVCVQACPNLRQSVFEKFSVADTPGPAYTIDEPIGHKQHSSRRLNAAAYSFGGAKRDRRYGESCAVSSSTRAPATVHAYRFICAGSHERRDGSVHATLSARWRRSTGVVGKWSGMRGDCSACSAVIVIFMMRL